MTHDELLAKIDSDIAKTDAVVGLQFCRPTFKALRAVVKLHKPRVNLDFPYQPVCQQCANIIDPWDENSYPCPTIQAIEKELS